MVGTLKSRQFISGGQAKQRTYRYRFAVVGTLKSIRLAVMGTLKADRLKVVGHEKTKTDYQ